nr:S1 RNA-binding domain-containing protein [Ornithinimicrobium sediminis]
MRPGDVWPAIVFGLHRDGVVVEFGDFAEGVIELADLGGHKVDHPGEVVEVGDSIYVRVLSVDTERQFASLALEPEQDETP